MNRWPFSSSNSIWPLPRRSKLTTEEVISSKPSTLPASACAAAMTLAPAAATAAAVILPRLLRLISASLLAIRSATDFMSLNSIKFSAPKYSRDTRDDPERRKRPRVFFKWSNTGPEITEPLMLSWRRRARRVKAFAGNTRKRTQLTRFSRHYAAPPTSKKYFSHYFQ